MKIIYTFMVYTLCVTCAFAQQSSLLEKYRSMALAYNHDLRAADKNIASSIELVKAAQADLKPKLTGDASIQYTQNPMELSIQLPQTNNLLAFQGLNTKMGASLTLLQPIYTGGRILESIRLARHQQSLSAHQAELLLASVCYQTDMQYWNTVARAELVNIVTDYRNSIASLVETIRERVDAGLVASQDLLMAEVKLNEANYQLLQSKSQFDTNRMALNSLIGLELNTQTQVDDTIPSVNFSNSLLLLNGSNRPELLMAQDQIKIAESLLKLNDSKYRPQLYVGADGNYTSPGYNFHSDMDPNYMVYAKVAVPIFEWGKRRTEKRASTWKIGMANDHLNKITDRVNLNVQTAQTSLIQAMQQASLTSSSLEKACENERKTQERYDEGEVSIVEVIEAKNYRQNSQINYVQAKVWAQGNYSELLKALHRY